MGTRQLLFAWVVLVGPLASAQVVPLEDAFDPCGGIRAWNVLGAYGWKGEPVPFEEMLRWDYMTDGSVGEKTFEWLPGATIATAFCGAAATCSIDGGASGRNPDGVPTVFSWLDPDGRIDATEVFASNIDSVMLYAQTYVVNATGSRLDVYLGCSSDDAIQVLLNGDEVWINACSRMGSDACAPQDVSPDGVRFSERLVLREGSNSLIVKAFDVFGGWDFAVRFQDELGSPVTAGLFIRLDPGGPPPPAGFRRGDSNGDGVSNISDVVFTLNHLFLGGADPECLEAADADDDGQVNLTDPVRLLDHLFRSGLAPPPPGPGPGPCGEDPEGSPSLGCRLYAEC